MLKNKIQNSIQNFILEKERGLTVAIFLLPFFIFSWMIPFLAGITIGNDYGSYSIYQQMELMFSLKTGSFPLFIPGFAGGQSSSALTLGQLFHPISYIASMLPGYWSGKALEWNTLLRLISLGAVHLCLFKFLRNLKFDKTVSFILSFITVYNLRMLDLFRYGASLESWTGYLMLCAAIGSYYIKPTKIIGPLTIIGSTYWLLCSGHPQMVYYGVVGVGIFFLIIPYFIKAIGPYEKDQSENILRFWLVTGFSCILGLLLSSAYVMPFYFEFIETNALRVNSTYAFASTYCDTFIGTVNNFFNPLRSDVHGVFGGSSLFLISAILPFLKFFRVKIPRVIWILWGVFIFVFLHMQGNRLPVHYFMWKYFPFASSFRVAGRISLILPIFLMLILAWIVRAKKPLQLFKIKYVKISSLTVLAGVALFVTGAYLCIYELIMKSNTAYWATSIRRIPFSVEMAVYITGVMSLVLFLVYGHLSRKKPAIGYMLFLSVCMQIMFLIPYGTWIDNKKETPSYDKMLAQKKERLTYRHSSGSGTSTKAVYIQARESFLEPFLGKIYQKYIVAKNRKASYDIMREGRYPDQVVIENYSPGQCLDGKEISDGDYAQSHVDLAYSSFNRVVFNVQTATPGFFGISFPYMPNWKATVNNLATPVFQGNGASMVVCIPPGQSRVEFRYHSGAMMVGMIISCATLILIGLVASILGLKKPLKYFLPVIVLIMGSGIFLLWFSSLYTGENLHTIYRWSSKPPGGIFNLAYGKKAILSSNLDSENPYLNSGEKAVDGDYTPGSGFLTAIQEKPAWTINLSRPELIGSVNVFSALKGKYVNKKPLLIGFALNPDKWMVMPLREKDGIMRVTLKAPVRARYVQIRASGNCLLALDEVELFPPEK